jgi:hypothetical protein
VCNIYIYIYIYIYIIQYSLSLGAIHERGSLVLVELTPWNRVLFEKLTGPQLVKEFPVFYGTLRFMTVFTGARHLSLS